MSQSFFKALENNPDGHLIDRHTLLGEVVYNADGLIPVIAQEHESGEVLMMAWMNAKALERTIDSGRMTYWSRSRQSFWVKGESSGNTQEVVEVRLDCDGDALLCRVRQKGGACHTGRSNCFYWKVDEKGAELSP